MIKNQMKVLDLFSGIGGFSLGLERTGGFETVAFCEIEPFCQKVLRKHWPDIPIYEDVKDVTRERLVSDGIGRIDVITGGFPCQDISVAGNQKGIEAERSGLWSELIRLVGEIQPRYALFENVTNLLNGERGDWFKRVLWDISQIGYDAEWECISAASIGAHHRRDRIWIIAHPRDSEVLADSGSARSETRISRPIKRQEGQSRIINDSSYQRLRREAGSSWATEPSVCGMDDGLPDGIYQGRTAVGIKDRAARLKCLGNSVVPQIPELIGRAILESHDNI